MGEMNMNQTTQPEVSKKLTKKDITKSMWIYYAGAELSNSYERLQSLVFCASMTPILKKLYSTDEELSEALKRHLVFLIQRVFSERSYRVLLSLWKNRNQTARTLQMMRLQVLRPVLWDLLPVWETQLYGRRLCRLSSLYSFRLHQMVLRSAELCR